MDLKSLLQKTKEKSEKVVNTRTKVNVATDDRPYDIVASSEEVNKISKNISSTPVVIPSNHPEPKLIKSSEIKKETKPPVAVTHNRIVTNEKPDIIDVKDKTTVTNPLNKVKTRTNQRQTGDKVETITVPKFISPIENQTYEFNISPDSFSAFAGIQRTLLLFLFEECKRNRSTYTRPLTCEFIATTCGINPSTIKKTIQRLEKREIIIRGSYRDGRGGWTQYGLAERIYNEILNLETANVSINPPIQTKQDVEKTTKINLPTAWSAIDISPLKSINFGFTELKNIYKSCPFLTVESIQESINQFAFGLNHNPARYQSMKSPSAVLVNHLCQGDRWIEEGFISAEEKARKEKEEKITQKFKEPKFIEWFDKLTEEEKEKYVPAILKSDIRYNISKEVYHKEFSKKEFDATIWPTILNDLKNKC